MANKEITNHNELDFLMNWGIDSPLDAPPDFSAILDSAPSLEVSNNPATSCSAIQPQTASVCQQLPALQGHPSRYHTSCANNQRPVLAQSTDNYNLQGTQYQGHQYFGQQTVQVHSSNSHNYSQSGNRNALPASQEMKGYSLLNDNLNTWSEVNRNVPASSSRIQPQAVNDFQNPTGSADQNQYHHFSNQASYNNKQQSCQNMPVFQNDSSRYQTSYINGRQSVPASRPMTTDYYNQRMFPQQQIRYAPQVTHSHPSCSHAGSNLEYANVQKLWQATNPYSSLTNSMPQMRSDQPLLSRNMTDTTIGSNSYLPAWQATHSYSSLIPQCRSDPLPASMNRTDMMPQSSSDQQLVSTNLVSQNSPDKPLESTKRKATPTFACETCGSVFVRKSSLMEHMKRHSDFLGYSCATCNVAFNDRSTLSKHIRTHTGERPYSCDTCGARFTQSGNLKRHERKFH